MLALGVREGDYVMIGDQIKVQVIQTGNLFRLGIEAPKDMRILRHTIYERENPDAIPEKTYQRPSKQESRKKT